MEAVIKVGGSLSEIPGNLRALGVELCNIAKKHQIVVVPGGGKFADAVRELDLKFKLPALFSHRMAILAMDQYGLFLSQIIPESSICDSIEDANHLSGKGKVPLFLPSRLLFDDDPFPASWDVTSDSIAAHIAIELKATKAILVTDVDGIFTEDPKQHPDAKLLTQVSAEALLRRIGRTSVDRFLPELLTENKLETYVVNGAFPKRINDVLTGQSTVCSRITPT